MYQVLKKIKGRDYLYSVERRVDPQTARAKSHWQYLGAVENGTLRAPTRRGGRSRVTREDIIAAAVRLLRFRGPEHLTVKVIAAAANASRSAFYRNFDNQGQVIDLAVGRIAAETVTALPALEGAPLTPGRARTLLHDWCDGLMEAASSPSAQRLGQPFARAIVDAAIPVLADFLLQLNDSNLSPVSNAQAGARAIVEILWAVHGVGGRHGIRRVIERALFGHYLTRSTILPRT